MATMAGSGSATSRSLADVSKAAVYNTAQALSSSLLGMKPVETTPSTNFGLLGRVVLSIFSVLPTILYWITYTLPTWLFTLFSMSLTFTMNFTTL
jgi:lysophospholipid hydrolase